ncbi:hypothetical protein GS966_11190 [Rhodococcus hoagii]|nr:hypothetical protein [Prescottella equi]
MADVRVVEQFRVPLGAGQGETIVEDKDQLTRYLAAAGDAGVAPEVQRRTVRVEASDWEPFELVVEPDK